MPELPDVTVYIEVFEKRLVGDELVRIRFGNPFLLRTVSPTPEELVGKQVAGLRRIGKRIVIELGDHLFIVIHLMIAGRFKWLAAGAKIAGKVGLAAFDFKRGTLLLTEQGSKRRASLHLVRGENALRELNPPAAWRSSRSRSNSSAKRSAGSATDDDESVRRGDVAPLRRDPLDPHRVDRSAARRGRRKVPGKSHRVPSRDGRAWQVQRALPRLRHEGPADRLRREQWRTGALACPDRRGACPPLSSE